ncbi:MAG: hypothetical protein Q8R36_02625, partial [bacterium]|nr:hypothetical protein [bacterium]
MAEEKKADNEVRVAFFSRLDYCGTGYRRHLVERGFHIAEAEQPHFSVLVGGLVHNTGLKKQIEEAVAEDKNKPKNEQGGRKEITNRVLDKVAVDLA